MFLFLFEIVYFYLKKEVCIFIVKNLELEWKEWYLEMLL